MRSVRGVPAAVLAALAFTATACSTQVTTTPDGSHSPGGSATAAQAAHLGQAITIKGNDNGEQLTVTPVKAGVTKSTSEYDMLDAGKEYYAVQFKLENSGTVAHDSLPEATVSDASGQQFDGGGGNVAMGPDFPMSLTVAPGGHALGVLVFEIPKGTRITGVQWKMNSGFGDVGEWKVP